MDERAHDHVHGGILWRLCQVMQAPRRRVHVVQCRISDAWRLAVHGHGDAVIDAGDVGLEGGH